MRLVDWIISCGSRNLKLWKTNSWLYKNRTEQEFVFRFHSLSFFHQLLVVWESASFSFCLSHQPLPAYVPHASLSSSSLLHVLLCPLSFIFPSLLLSPSPPLSVSVIRAGIEQCLQGLPWGLPVWHILFTTIHLSPPSITFFCNWSD